MTTLESIKDLDKWKNSEQFRAHVDHWARRVRVTPKRVYVRPMAKKWASCSTNGLLSFNTQLLSESPEFGEYVIVHELLHLKTPNHGKLFKSLLTAHLPDWRERVQKTSTHPRSLHTNEIKVRRKGSNTLGLTREQIDVKRAYARKRAQMIKEDTWKTRKSKTDASATV